jgi:hypothetical protein
VYTHMSYVYTHMSYVYTHMSYVYTHNTHYTELYQQNSKLACNSEGTDKFPEDGTQLPKRVGAAK